MSSDRPPCLSGPAQLARAAGSHGALRAPAATEGRHYRLVGLTLLAVAFFATGRCSGSEESQALSARGLIALQAGRTQEAKELFDRAVAADPDDPDARFQRGAMRAKVGDYSGALEDLRIAYAARPNATAVAVELGVALSETGNYAEAEPLLVRAQSDPQFDAQASFFLGLTQLRLGRLDEAEQNFNRARSKDPSLATASEYYLGVISYRRHDYDSAETHFTAVQDAKPDSTMAAESRNFIVQMRRGRRAAYSVFGGAAFQYDTNVTLGPSSDTVAQGITGEGDGRFVINAGGRYIPWSQGPAALALSYEFFQSLHFRLTDFNLQDHRPAAQFTLDFDPVLVGVLGRYDYYLLQTDSFLSEGTAFPWVSLREQSIGRTDVYYRLQWRDYKKKFIGAPPPEAGPCTTANPNGCGFKQLDGFYNFVGVRQVINLGDPSRQLWLGYQMGFNNMENVGSDRYQYGEQQFEVALRWLLPYAVTAEAGYQYAHQDYAPQSADLNQCNPQPCGPPRRDNDNRVIVSFERPLSELWEPLFVNAAWYGTWNNSNNLLFEYDRQIGSIGAEVRF